MKLQNVMLFLNTPQLGYDYLGAKTERGYCTRIKRIGLGYYAILGGPNPKVSLLSRIKWRWLIAIQPLEYWIYRVFVG